MRERKKKVAAACVCTMYIVQRAPRTHLPPTTQVSSTSPEINENG